MTRSSQPEGRYASTIATQVPLVLEAVLGSNYRSRVTFYESIPKGLFRGGRLMLAPGLAQRLLIYGRLNPQEIDAILRVLGEAIRNTRGQDAAPIAVRFLREEIFVVQADGSRSRGEEILLRQELLGSE